MPVGTRLESVKSACPQPLQRYGCTRHMAIPTAEEVRARNKLSLSLLVILEPLQLLNKPEERGKTGGKTLELELNVLGYYKQLGMINDTRRREGQAD